ncbi:Protein of unknown function [Gryllus bimaculatus]|nr:Protein of unknown function [Gryllus bimaculatus]
MIVSVTWITNFKLLNAVSIPDITPRRVGGQKERFGELTQKRSIKEKEPEDASGPRLGRVCLDWRWRRGRGPWEGRLSGYGKTPAPFQNTGKIHGTSEPSRKYFINIISNCVFILFVNIL